VVEEDGTFVGLIGQHELREALVQRADTPGLLLAEDLAEPIEPLRPSQSLREALGAMNARGRDALPVTERDVETGRERFRGVLAREDVLIAYERELEHAV
jgi:CBS domain-containing protein